MEPTAPKRWPMLVGVAVRGGAGRGGHHRAPGEHHPAEDRGEAEFVKLVEVDESTVDPKVWGVNWPREYDSYSEDGGAEPDELRRRRRVTGAEGAAVPLADADLRRVRVQPGLPGPAGARVHAPGPGEDAAGDGEAAARGVPPLPREHHPGVPHVGKGDVMKGFEEVCAMKYQEAHALKDASGAPLVDHPVSCVDCHDPKTMALRVTRPGFLVGIKALKEHQGVKDYDVNRDASRQEMRSYVCGQCHVEYYFRGDHKLLTYPWKNGLKADEIEAYYDDGANFADGKPYKDWVHAESGAPVLKAQHPEFELWNQGIHARSGVACADCHMPYIREGAVKVSDHWVRSPLLNVSRACQTCHPYPEGEIQARVAQIQGRNHDLLQRAGGAIVEMLDALKAAKAAGATDAQLAQARALQRKAQWRLDFVAAENSMGFHAPQEAARILGEAMDYGRQAQLSVEKLRLGEAKPAAAKGGPQ